MDTDQSKHRKKLSWLEAKLLPVVRVFCRHEWIEEEAEEMDMNVEGGWRLIFSKYVCTRCGEESSQDTNPQIVGPKTGGGTGPR